MSLVITRPVTETITNTETGETADITMLREFEVIQEGNALHFVRQGAIGSKVGNLTKEALAIVKGVASPKK